jgi:UDP-GlcNAc3NAcA epimerase
MKRILTVIGARPQFIKAATISRVIKEQYAASIEEIIVHTGQHYDQNMSDVFFQEMKIPQPKYSLNIGGKSHSAMTGEMLIELERIMQAEKPDMVLVYGDTNSTLAAALSASKLHIPVAHIEAGMRAFNKRIPEEINRILTDHISTHFFCTTEEPANNLKEEGLTQNIHIVGDVMYDAVLFYKKIMQPSKMVKSLPNGFYLATIHRQENTDDEKNLGKIFSALSELSKEKMVVLPLHPRTRKCLNDFNIKITPGIKIIDPVGYFDMLYLLENSSLVLTDSGGLQKEAYYFNKPAVIMRDQTEWVDLVEKGVAKLTGADKDEILMAVRQFVGMASFPKNLYGDGSAADKVVNILEKSM